MNHSTDSADLPISINSSRWHLPYPIVLDYSVMEGALDEENDVISVKGNLYKNKLLDGNEKITETSLESASSRVIPAFAADEGTMDGKEVIKVHCVDDGGDDRKDKVEEDGIPMDGRAPQAAGACMHQRRKGTRKCLLPGKTNGQD
ncbi:hypothetical protein HPP92_001593 [Vanilla planifolia]|uniref:Uncharacterized protein n=1 Tax=Vanilla planifolia TaxID=51239 RepID=A0A835VLZ3_VANPL|nr:hypothetical protein HPP92_001593 [Vanilla planifolia]